jgi:hypothetical protein
MDSLTQYLPFLIFRRGSLEVVTSAAKIADIVEEKIRMPFIKCNCMILKLGFDVQLVRGV